MKHTDPLVSMALTLVGVAIVVVLMLALTGNIHCWNIPLIGKGCNIH